MAKRPAESPAENEHLMERSSIEETLKKALKRVQANRGSAGVDRMTLQQLPEFLREQWPVTENNC